mmetsp:Transcript_3940/g.12536  ORF Transcript_3940/g.12536 Transcript_3940/m.12536 type:complete len:87 (+) Transcript_3940:1588-1848(+)
MRRARGLLTISDEVNAQRIGNAINWRSWPPQRTAKVGAMAEITRQHPFYISSHHAEARCSGLSHSYYYKYYVCVFDEDMHDCSHLA